MGQRASDTRGITFEDVVIPKEVRCVSCYMKLCIFAVLTSYLSAKPNGSNQFFPGLGLRARVFNKSRGVFLGRAPCSKRAKWLVRKHLPSGETCVTREACQINR